jgi:microcystin-dependent protein
MSDQFLAEIRIVGFNFAPLGWAQCNGQLMSISQNTALFSLLGTNYGGDGKSTFGLPNLQGAAPMGAGTGPSLTPRIQGETGGEYTVPLQTGQMAAHTHPANCTSAPGTSNTPAGNFWADAGGRGAQPAYANAGTSLVSMSNQAIQLAGGAQPHNNLQPYLTLTFVIALQGIYPTRS